MERFNEFNKKNTETAKTNENFFFAMSLLKKKKKRKIFKMKKKSFLEKLQNLLNIFFI